MMALNTELKKYGGSECQANQWVWVPNWRHNSERQTEDMMALNAESKKYGGSECQADQWL